MGEGGSAIVYRATDELLGRQVAVKVFHSDRVGLATPARQRIEMLASASLQHPNLVVVYDAHVPAPGTDGVAYMVLELVEGGPAHLQRHHHRDRHPLLPPRSHPGPASRRLTTNPQTVRPCIWYLGTGLPLGMASCERSSAVMWAPSSCSLPTPERPLRVAEFDEFFAAAVLGWERQSPCTAVLDLRADPVVAGRAGELIASETGCCSFFSFTLAATGGRLTLTITVPAEDVTVLDGLTGRLANVTGAR